MLCVYICIYSHIYTCVCIHHSGQIPAKDRGARDHEARTSKILNLNTTCVCFHKCAYIYTYIFYKYVTCTYVYINICIYVYIHIIYQHIHVKYIYYHILIHVYSIVNNVYIYACIHICIYQQWQKTCKRQGSSRP